MQSLRRVLSAIIVMVVFCGWHMSAQPGEAPDAKSLTLSSQLPLHPKVRAGRLDNGVTYYILRNGKPENRAELRLAINAGSVLETDEQQGLAHFVEHMAFNGTKNFRKDALVKWMESVGMRFGADVNAYTSFDETVYMLQVPTDNVEQMSTAFQILEDWAHTVQFEHEEIDKERGVIIEEMRGGKGASQRIRDLQFPVMYHGSLYAQRLPIGKEDILKSFPYETLKRFYHDWYRPDLMAVIAVGDFDERVIEQKIKDHFSRINRREKTVERPVVPVPDHAETLYSIVTDPEATGTSLTVNMKHDAKNRARVVDFRRVMIERLLSRMLNDRFDELTRKENPPFLSAFAAYRPMNRTKEAFTVSVSARNGELLTAGEAAWTEALRARRHGFTESELERAKTNMMTRMEESYREREKLNSRDLIGELVQYFLRKEPMPGIELEHDLYKKYLPSVTLKEVLDRMKDLFTDKNTVVLASMPEKTGLTVPSEEDLRSLFRRVESKTIEAYVDNVVKKPLADVPSNTVKARDIRTIGAIGVTEWTLSNGIKVIVKPTDFKNDEILFAGFSPGGSSLAADKDDVSASMSSGIVSASGLGDFDAVQLRKHLTGKTVSVSPFISELQEGFNGSVSPKDIETLFQLVYLHFTAPRKDETAFKSMMTRMRAMLENMRSRPEAVFSDTVSMTMAQYHPRRRPMNAALLDDVNLDVAQEFYRDRFADASDFTFLFVGNVDPSELRPLTEKYLGSLPSTRRKESWKDLGVSPPKGVVEKTVRKGIEAKASVQLHFTGPAEWTLESRYLYASLIELMRMKLRESIREEKGGTYGVGVMGPAERKPRERYRLIVSFGCNPERVDELTTTAMDVLKELREKGSTQEYVDKIREIQRRERETQLKENRFWLGRLQQAYSDGDDPLEVLEYPKLLESLSVDRLKEAANTYIDVSNYATFVLLPEKAAK